MKQDLIGPGYFSDPYYSSDAYKQKLAAAQRQERNRQDLMAGRATPGSLAYARFLSAVLNDATVNSEVGFCPNDTDVLRDYPFLRDLVEADPLKPKRGRDLWEVASENLPSPKERLKALKAARKSGADSEIETRRAYYAALDRNR